MKSSERKLFDKILLYYNEKNLTRITQKIIDAYRLKQYSYIIALANLIDPSLVSSTQNIQKLFSQLIMLYHPDRLSTILNDIKNLTATDESELKDFIHIITVSDNLDSIQYVQQETSINDEMEFEYGYDEEDFDSIIEGGQYSYYQKEDIENFQFDFISLLRYRELGSIEEELPSFYFEELEGNLDFSDSNIYDLSGLEKCINLKQLDLSNNQIVDINQIWFLKQLTEINLSGNNIYTIDVLKQLPNLQHIDISFNAISDIRPLLNLPNLKYLNVIENRISRKQLDLFNQHDIVFIY